MNKFEQLIEYVINDESEKARELFHDIVVEKSRGIYEQMMEAEEQEEESVEEAYEEEEESIEEGLGGDQSDDLIDDIETEEEGVNMEGEDEFGGDMGSEDGFADEADGEEGLEDRVVDLEDKLDELMAEFENLMGAEEAEHGEDFDLDGDEGDEFGSDMSDEEVADDEFETEGMMEAVTLKAVPKPTHGDSGANAKSPVAANSGAKGMAASPVKMTGDTAQGRPAPGTKELIGKVGNSPAQSTQKPTPAKKPSLGQASGVNTKSVIQ